MTVAGTEFWVVRHGESTWNACGRYQGQTDVPLSELGRLQALALAERLAGQEFAAVYASDLARAFQTGQIVTEKLVHPKTVQTDIGLREIDVGELGGLLRGDIQQRFPDYFAALNQDPWLTPRPGGESMKDLFQRTRAVFTSLCEEYAGRRVLVFTHGGVVRATVGLALGGVPTRAWTRLSVTNTSITRVLLGQSEGTLLSFNDSAHLENLSRLDKEDDLLASSNTNCG